MGIRFACHVCGKHLNIKRDLAGRRGVCPTLLGQIPNSDGGFGNFSAHRVQCERQCSVGFDGDDDSDGGASRVDRESSCNLDCQ